MRKLILLLLLLSLNSFGNDYSSDDKFTNSIMIEFIKGWGAGVVLDHAIKRFERDYFELNQMMRQEFGRIHQSVRREREREERRRHDGRDGGNHGSGGFLDNYSNGQARGGFGV